MTSTPDVGSLFVVNVPLASKANDVVKIRRPNLTQRRSVKILARHSGAAESTARLWRSHGADAVALSHDCTSSALISADVIWADLYAVNATPALQSLLLKNNLPAGLRICVVARHYNELAESFAHIQVPPPDGLHVRMVQRPVLLHQLIAALDAEEIKETDNYLEEGLTEACLSKNNGTAKTCTQIADSVATLVQVGDAAVVDRRVVLLVEDNPVRTRFVFSRDSTFLMQLWQVNQRLGKRLVEKLGYDVVTANNGQQAVDTVQIIQCHACLMDCQMPGISTWFLPLCSFFLYISVRVVLDGFSATRRIRRLEEDGILSSRLRIIALTANVTSESEAACLAAGMDAFLPKPLKISGMTSLSMCRFVTND